MFGYDSDQENSGSLTDELIAQRSERLEVNAAASAVAKRHRGLARLGVSAYIGGVHSHYKLSFEKALTARLKEKTTPFQQFATNLITKADVRKKAIDSPEELVAELKRNSSFIVISTHPGQGNSWWDYRTMPTAMKELEDFPFCFPAGIKLGCPVWLQHKWKYYIHLPDAKKLQSVSK